MHSGRSRRALSVRTAATTALAWAPSQRRVPSASCVDHGPQGVAALTAPKSDPHLMRTLGEVPVREDHARADRGDQCVQRLVERVGGIHRWRGRSQRQRQHRGGPELRILRTQCLLGQLRPRGDGGDAELGDGQQVARRPAPDVLVEQRRPRPVQLCPAALVRRSAAPLLRALRTTSAAFRGGRRPPVPAGP